MGEIFVNLVKKIIEIEEFKWKNDLNAKIAKTINIEAKIDAEVYLRRTCV